MPERDIAVECENDVVPCSLFEATDARGLVLLGHGLGVDRHDETVLRPASMLLDSGFSVVVPELPLHGERSVPKSNWAEVVSDWRNFWVGVGRDNLLREWLQILAHVEERFGLPIFYFGLSLGTQYGILILSHTKEVRAAVLGLFGSEPPPKSKIMNLLAPQTAVPVYFIQKLDDEIHPVESATYLYNSIGSRRKVLDATPGLHGEVGRESMQKACRFLVEHADA